ncbi:MAG TPA: RsmE family RNA methyltransferase [Candidatus Limnocylindria bacterium]|nr:RsmE family RNA methyltransferase [Candidatus Limnocylindria bacterium]
MSAAPRFFVPRGTVAAPRFALPGEIEHQVRRVLRLRDGAELIVLEGDGHETRCRLEGAGCVPIERRVSRGEPRHRLVVWQALLKGDHLAQVIEHGTEVGVAAFRLVVSERCVARDLSARRLERLRAIAREAAEQSERGAVPPVAEPVSVADIPWPTTVMLAERHEAAGLGELAAREPPGALAIGPEGGWVPSELAAAVGSGARLAGLGPRILRSETVAVAAAAVVLSRTGDFA